MSKSKFSYKSTGDLIRRLRTKKGITQTDLSRALGYGSKGQSVSNMERGVAGIPKRKIALLAKSLGVPKAKIVTAIVKQQTARLS